MSGDNFEVYSHGISGSLRRGPGNGSAVLAVGPSPPPQPTTSVDSAGSVSTEETLLSKAGETIIYDPRLIHPEPVKPRILPILCTEWGYQIRGGAHGIYPAHFSFKPTTITLEGTPPSINRMYATGRGRFYKKESVKAWQNMVSAIARTQVPMCIPKPKRLGVVIYFYVSNVSADIDNPIKPLLDSLQGVAFENDNQVDYIFAHKFPYPAEEPRTVVEIHGPIPYDQFKSARANLTPDDFVRERESSAWFNRGHGFPTSSKRPIRDVSREGEESPVVPGMPGHEPSRVGRRMGESLPRKARSYTLPGTVLRDLPRAVRGPVNAKTAAKVLGVCYAKVLEFARYGRIPCTVSGRTYWFTEADVEASKTILGGNHG